MSGHSFARIVPARVWIEAQNALSFRLASSMGTGHLFPHMHGIPLSEVASITSKIHDRPWQMRKQETAERRQVTVLHVDIVNSTALVDHLDPEEVMNIMQTYLDNCRAI